MKVVLARIDDRLIHGPIITVWSRETKCEQIIVCNDEATADPVRKTLLLQMVPPGVKVMVLSVENAIRVCLETKDSDTRALLLFTNPADVLRMCEQGVGIASVNIGGMSFRIGKKQIAKAICLDDNDMECFLKLHKLGIELEIRKVPADSRVDLMSLLERIE